MLGFLQTFSEVLPPSDFWGLFTSPVAAWRLRAPSLFLHLQANKSESRFWTSLRVLTFCWLEHWTVHSPHGFMRLHYYSLRSTVSSELSSRPLFAF
jgi:hypothetical protein